MPRKTKPKSTVTQADVRLVIATLNELIPLLPLAFMDNVLPPKPPKKSRTITARLTKPIKLGYNMKQVLCRFGETQDWEPASFLIQDLSTRQFNNAIKYLVKRDLVKQSARASDVYCLTARGLKFRKSLWTPTDPVTSTP